MLLERRHFVGGDIEGASIGRERDVADLPSAGRQLTPVGAVGQHRVQVREAVSFGDIPDAPAGVVPARARAAGSADPRRIAQRLDRRQRARRIDELGEPGFVVARIGIEQTASPGIVPAEQIEKPTRCIGPEWLEPDRRSSRQTDQGDAPFRCYVADLGADSQIFGISAPSHVLWNISRPARLGGSPGADEHRSPGWGDGESEYLLATLQIERLETKRLARQPVGARDAVGADAVAHGLEQVALLLLQSSALALSLR